MIGIRKTKLWRVFMEGHKKKRIVIILTVAAAAAVVVAAFAHAGEDDFLTDPARLAGSWDVEEIWQDQKLVNHHQAEISLDIDKNGGCRISKEDGHDEQRGKLGNADGQLRLVGAEGWIYDIHGKQRQLIVTAKKDETEETWICKKNGYCLDALRTEQEWLDTYFAIHKKAMSIKDETQRWFYVEIMLMMDGGCPEGKAIVRAKENCIRGRAFVWYAEEHDIAAADKEVEEYLHTLAQSLEENPKIFEGYDAALKKVKMTYEDYVQVNAEAHRWDINESAVYRKYPLQMETFGEDIVNRFHHTKAYRDLKVEMDDAVEKTKDEIHK